MQNKPNFQETYMSANVCAEKVYENESVLEAPKNKPNQSQCLFFTAENAGFAEQKCICISDCPMKKYNLYLHSLRSSRTRRLMRYKPNQSQCSIRQTKCRTPRGGGHRTACNDILWSFSTKHIRYIFCFTRRIRLAPALA